MQTAMEIAWNKVVSHLQSAVRENSFRQWSLRYEILDQVGVLRALSWFSCETEREYPDTVVEYSTSIEEAEIPEPLKPILFQVVYESVANSIFHGKAARVDIVLELVNGWLQLRIEDNGRGFNFADEELSSGNGFGLDHMRHQVESSGGVFSITSTPGMGTQVKAEWKIR